MNIKLTERDKIRVSKSEDIFEIMQRILLRENRIDREKEHFWVIGMNLGGVILYIELISMGSVRFTQVEPMHVYRVAILKGASRVILVHNHPSGTLKESVQDLDITDRLIQVGIIIDIEVIDHLIISAAGYHSFRDMGLVEELKKSLKHVPTYKVIEMVRAEEKAILDKHKAAAKELLAKERKLKKEIQQQCNSAIEHFLKENKSLEEIAKIMNITEKEVLKIKNAKKEST